MEDLPKARRKKVIRDVFLIILSVAVAILLHKSATLSNLLHGVFGFSFLLGAFITGIFFASTFTVAIAVSIFLFFADTHNPLMIAAIGGLGAFVGDSFIFKFLRDDLIADFEYLEKYFPKKTAIRIIHSKLTIWLVPIIAALMIASPIPDEVGLLMLAGIKLRYHHFFILSFFLNTFGILLVSLFGKTI